MFVSKVNNTVSEVNIAVCLHFYFSIFLHFCTHFAYIYSHFLLNIHILSLVGLFAASGGSGWGGWCLRHFTQNQNYLHNIYQTLFCVSKFFSLTCVMPCVNAAFVCGLQVGVPFRLDLEEAYFNKSRSLEILVPLCGGIALRYQSRASHASKRVL